LYRATAQIIKVPAFYGTPNITKEFQAQLAIEMNERVVVPVHDDIFSPLQHVQFAPNSTGDRIAAGHTVTIPRTTRGPE
jgi:hypothetical protein